MYGYSVNVNVCILGALENTAHAINGSINSTMQLVHIAKAHAQYGCFQG